MRLQQIGYAVRLQRVRVGTEKTIADQMRAQGRSAFIALGRYDLVTLDEIASLDKATDARVNVDSLGHVEVVCGLPFADYAHMPGLLDAPAIVLTFFQLGAGPGGLPTLEEELATAEQLRGLLPRAAVLHSIGAAELVVVQGGDSLGEMLDDVVQVRQTIAPRLAGSTSVIAIHPQRYLELKSDERISTRLGLICRPSRETAAIDHFAFGPGFNIFGPQDLAVDNATPDVAGMLSDLLRARAARDVPVVDTSVSLALPVPEREPLTRQPDRSPYGEAVRQYVRQVVTELHGTILRAPNADVVVDLDEIAADLVAAAAGVEHGSLGLEHLVAFEVLRANAEMLAANYGPENTDATSGVDRLELESWVRSLARNLATSMYQRSAGGDPYYELSTAALGLASRSQSRLHAAVSACLWWSVSSASPEIMPMFAVFGEYQSPKYLLGGVGLPDYFLRRPLQEWWRTAHEAGHAVAESLEFVGKGLTNRQLIYLQSLARARTDVSDLDILQLAEELFAQWFDYVVAFNEDARAYQTAIWRSWLRVPLVWSQPVDYLSRSLAMWVHQYADQWREQRESAETSLTFLRVKMDELADYLTDTCPRFTPFWEALTDVGKNAALRTVNTVFRQTLGALQGLRHHLDPAMPTYDQLDEHVSAILRCEVLTERIPSPPRLLVRLRKSVDDEGGGVVTFGQEMALILSLWNTYQLICMEQLPQLFDLSSLSTAPGSNHGSAD